MLSIWWDMQPQDHSIPAFVMHALALAWFKTVWSLQRSSMVPSAIHRLSRPSQCPVASLPRCLTRAVVLACAGPTSPIGGPGRVTTSSFFSPPENPRGLVRPAGVVCPTKGWAGGLSPLALALVSLQRKHCTATLLACNEVISYLLLPYTPCCKSLNNEHSALKEFGVGGEPRMQREPNLRRDMMQMLGLLHVEPLVEWGVKADSM